VEQVTTVAFTALWLCIGLALFVGIAEPYWAKRNGLQLRLLGRPFVAAWVVLWPAPLLAIVVKSAVEFVRGEH
jgi:hypothetical protein